MVSFQNLLGFACEERMSQDRRIKRYMGDAQWWIERAADEHHRGNDIKALSTLVLAVRMLELAELCYQDEYINGQARETKAEAEDVEDIDAGRFLLLALLSLETTHVHVQRNVGPRQSVAPDR